MILCAGRLFGQVFETAAGRVDLENDTHYGAYLQNKTNRHDKTKIIWYPGVGLYRPCGEYTAPKPVPATHRFVAKDCNCAEKFSYVIALPSTMPYGNIQFEFDSSAIRTSSYQLLDAMSADLRSTGSKIVVAGYASSEGTAGYNMVLSLNRANAVKNYLIQSGVNREKITVKAYGETNPIADNSTEEGRILNRRVEFKKP